MSSYARIEIHGNLGSDPETKYTPNGAMLVEFSVAVNNWRKPDEPATWYRVTAWRESAERLTGLVERGSLRKGSSVVVWGTPSVRQYTNNAGEHKVSQEVTFADFEFAGGARKDDATNDGPTSF